MRPDIEKSKNAENTLPIKKDDFWQHRCGLFEWNISEKNVSLFCPVKDFDKVSWPECDIKNKAGG